MRVGYSLTRFRRRDSNSEYRCLASAVCYMSVCVMQSIGETVADAHPGMDHVCDVWRIGVEGCLLCIGYLITHGH